MSIAEQPLETLDQTPEQEAVAAVTLGLYVSATRCVLTYVIAPAAGALGLFLGPLGLVLQLLGAVTSAYGAKRLWALGHRLRYVYAVVALAVGTASMLAVGQALADVVR